MLKEATYSPHGSVILAHNLAIQNHNTLTSAPWKRVFVTYYEIMGQKGGVHGATAV
jgi:hypothetical protein